MSAVRDGCKEYPDIRLPPWNFQMQDKNANASENVPVIVQPLEVS